jgi:hypothetical protein
MALRMLTIIGLFYFIMCEDPEWIEIHWNSIWLRAQSHMTSHYTWGPVTTLHDFGGVLGWPLDTFFWSLRFRGHGSWLVCEVALRAASHYGRRSRGCRFPPITLQETKSSASRPFTLWPKSKGRRILKRLLFEEGDGLSKEVWVGREMVERPSVSFH